MQSVRFYRQRAGLSQAELASRAGLLQPQLSYIETGAHAPTPATLNKVADALGVAVWELLLMEDALEKQRQIQQELIAG